MTIKHLAPLSVALALACGSPITAPEHPLATLARAGVSPVDKRPSPYIRFLQVQSNGGAAACISCRWSCCTMDGPRPKQWP